MKKIVAYIGSRKGEFSNTYKFNEKIVDKIKEKNSNVEIEIITPKDLIINPCIGCDQCFVKGECSIDQLDDMAKLREKILKADLIIFGSPVYAHNVSGDMKIFFDRISYWLHNMKLNRKYAAVISTTSSNGHSIVIDYIEEMMYYLGAKVLFKKNCAIYYPSEFHNKAWLEKTADELSDKIVHALQTKITSDNNLEGVFQSFKLRYEYMKRTGDVTDNLKEGVAIELYKSESFQEFLDNYQEIK